MSKMGPRGFTLVELMITLVVMGILMSLALPSFSTFILSQRTKAAAFDLESAVYFARAEAIKRGKEVGIASSTGTGDWSQGWTIKDGATVLQQQGPYERIAIEGKSGDAGGADLDSLVYKLDGRAAGNAARFSVTAPSDANATSRCVRISTSGMPVTMAGMTGGCP